jgi:outer membrane protein assembly factor BamB
MKTMKPVRSFLDPLAMSRVVLFAVALASVSCASAEQVPLLNGRVLDGEVSNVTAQGFDFKLPYGQAKYAWRMVDLRRLPAVNPRLFESYCNATGYRPAPPPAPAPAAPSPPAPAAPVAAVAPASVAPAGDGWPQWRGPNRDDLSTEKGLLTEWPSDGPPLAWKFDGLGAGYSGVAVAKGKVFTMGDVGQESLLIVLDEATGKKLWSLKLGRPGQYGNFYGPRGTPTVDGDFVYALNQHGDLVCAAVATGKEIWRKSLQDLGGKPHGWGYAESPLVEGDKVLCTPGGSKGAIAALNKKTGAHMWQSKEFTDGAHYSSLIPATIFGVRQVIQLTAASVAGVGMADGKLLWRADRPGKTAVIPTPIYADNQVYVCSGYGVGCNAFKLTKETAGIKAAEAYATKDMANHHGGVILLDGHLYGFCDNNRKWLCQNFKTGEIVWSHNGVGKGSITYADGHFYLRNESGKGTVALIEASSKSYDEKARFNQPDRSDKNSWPHPVIANGRLYLRDQDVLLCYSVKAK